MKYTRVPTDATQLMKGKLIVSRQRVPGGEILLYAGVENNEEGDVQSVTCLSSTFVPIKEPFLKKFVTFFFGYDYKWQPMSEFLDKQGSDSIMN